MIELAILLLSIGVLCGFAKWRLGLLLTLGTALLQDPLRKLTPDQPVIFVVFAGVVFAGACLGAWSRGVSLTPQSMFGHQRQLMMAIWLLLLLIVVEAFNSYVRFGNVMIPLIGLLTYLLPVPSVVFAYQLALRGGEARILQFWKAYVLCTMLAVTTIYLGYVGYDWPVLKTVGTPLYVFDKIAGAVVLQSGIFRSPEIAAWHAMTCVTFVLLLMTVTKISFRSLLFAAVAVALLVGIGALTGRRKMIIEVVVFAGTYFILWAIFQKGLAKLGIALAIVGLVGSVWMMALLSDVAVPGDGSLGYSLYLDRVKSVFQDVPSRFVELGIAPIMWAYDGFGPLGAGLGVGTQGTQQFGVGGATAAPAEGGLGKIMLELGIPGLFLIGWLGISLFRYLWQIMRASSRISPEIGRLSFGLFSFLVANVAGFSIGTQAYGDLFILLILSWMLGFLLAVPALSGRKVRARQPAIVDERAPVFLPGTA